MLKIYQQTLKDCVTLSGTGLHTGKNSNIKILPAESNQGITFKRIDLKEIISLKQIIKMLLMQLSVQPLRIVMV